MHFGERRFRSDLKNFTWHSKPHISELATQSISIKDSSCSSVEGHECYHPSRNGTHMLKIEGLITLADPHDPRR